MRSRTKLEKFKFSNPVRIDRKIYKSIQYAAKKLGLHWMTIRYRLDSDQWPGYEFLDQEMCDRLYPHYRGNDIGRRFTHVYSMKQIRPFWYKDQFFKSLHEGQAALGTSFRNIHLHLQKGSKNYRYATEEEIQQKIKDGHFDRPESVSSGSSSVRG